MHDDIRLKSCKFFNSKFIFSLSCLVPSELTTILYLNFCSSLVVVLLYLLVVVGWCNSCCFVYILNLFFCVHVSLYVSLKIKMIEERRIVAKNVFFFYVEETMCVGQKKIIIMNTEDIFFLVLWCDWYE